MKDLTFLFNSYLYIGLFFLIPYLSFAQDIEFVVKDISTLEPIGDVLIFVDGKTVHKTSDLDGKASFDLKEIINQELVFTHLGYQNYSTSIAINGDSYQEIFMEARSNEIDEVVVKSKKSDKRKKWLEDFRDSFLGKNNSRRKVKILNEEAILFSEVDNKVQAFANEPIRINNKELGYSIQFFLEEYTALGEDVNYSGKVFFEDLYVDKKPSRKVRKARLKKYKRSKKHFFQPFIRDELNMEEYSYGIAKSGEDPLFIDSVPRDSLPMQYSPGIVVDTLYVDGYLIVAHKDLGWNKSSSKLQKILDVAYTSLLFPKNNRILLSKYGQILNSNEVEEYGLWAENRVGDLLPTNYHFDGEQYEPGLSELYVARAGQYFGEQDQDKVYLHTDKPYYALGNTIWFRTYLMNADDHRPKSEPEVVHVYLQDPDDNYIDSCTMLVPDRSAGEFDLRMDYPDGTYRISAYTRHMLNYDDHLMYSREFEVYDFSKEIYAQDDADQKDDDWELVFYPEGGTLVDGLQSNVAFTVTTKSKNKLDFNGWVKDKDGRVYGDLKLLHQNMGMFGIVPENDKELYVEASLNGMTKKFELPTSQPSGSILKVSNRNEEKISVTISNSATVSQKGNFIIGHVRGRIFCFLDDVDSTDDFVVSKSDMPSGVVHFTLFNDVGSPIAERITFNDYGVEKELVDISSNYSHYYPRQEVELEFVLPDTTYIGKEGQFSISVVDASVIQTNGVTNIQNYALLNSDVDLSITNPDYYLRDITSAKRAELDLILMTRGWRKFNWGDMSSYEVDTSYTRERGPTVSGRTTHQKKHDESIISDVLIASINASPFSRVLSSDKDGLFQIENLPFKDSTEMILQASNTALDNGDGEWQMDKNAHKVKIWIDTLSLPKLQKLDPLSATENLTSYDLLSREQDANRVDTTNGKLWNIEVEEVVITQKYRVHQHAMAMTNVANADWIHPQTVAKNLLGRLKPGTIYGFRTFKPFDPFEDPNHFGLVAKYKGAQVPIQLIIDGEPQTNADELLWLRAEDIAWVGIHSKWSHIVSIVLTDKGRNPKRRRDFDNIVNLSFPGYYKAREFPNPDYSVYAPSQEEADLRTTIYWDPKVSFDDQGKYKLQFYSADSESNYEVRLEGLLHDGTSVFTTFPILIQQSN